MIPFRMVKHLYYVFIWCTGVGFTYHLCFRERNFKDFGYLEH
jgi:hypothetical protein